MITSNISTINIIRIPLRFAQVGDIHIDGSYPIHKQRLDKIVTFLNSIPSNKLDFVVFMGDLVDNGDVISQWTSLRSSFSNLNKPYYIVIGNHDVCAIGCPNCYVEACTQHTGTLTHKTCNPHTQLGIWPDQLYRYTKDNINYQLIFIGTCDAQYAHWKFNFSNPNIDKNAPTIVFTHGPAIDPFNITDPNERNICLYATSVYEELKKFSKLIDIYAGHVHKNSNILTTYTITGTTQQNTIRHITVDGPVSWDVCGLSSSGYSRTIGYTANFPNSNLSNFAFINYLNADDTIATFTDPFPIP